MPTLSLRPLSGTLLRPLLALVVAVVLGLTATASAQGAPHRMVLLPFDSSASVEAFGLAFPVALQRSLNEIDGLFVPAVGDAATVLDRVADAAEAAAADGVAAPDVLATLARVFSADSAVLARVSGNDGLSVELVVLVGGVEQTRQLSGRAADLPGLWRELADAILQLAGLTPSNADRAAMRAVLGDAPSLPSLGPLGLAGSRLPGSRLDQLELARSLDPESAWAQAEFAFFASLNGQDDAAVEAAARAVSLQDGAETRAVEGVVRMAAGDLAAGQQALETALQHNPSHALALAALALSLDDPARSAGLLERAVVAAPRLAEAQIALASLQTSTTRALQLLRRAAENLPDSVSVQRALIDIAVAADDPRGALSLLQTAVTDPVGRTPGIYSLAAYLPASVAGEALILLRQGREIFPASSSLMLAEIDLLRRSGDVDAAETALRSAVEASPRSLPVVQALAEVLAGRGDVDEAQALLATVADLDADADLRSAQIDLAAGRARAALATLAPTVEAGTADVDRRAIYGIALGRLGRIDEARAMLQAVLDEAPDFELVARALALLEEQNQIAGTTGATALEPEAAVAFEQGLFALEVGDYVAAGGAFARARDVQDAGILAFYQGYALHRLGDVRGAIMAYQAAQAEMGNSDILLNNLGYAHTQVGRFDLALVTLRQALAINPQNALAHFNLGLALYGSERFGDAVTAFDTALALQPSLESVAGPYVEDARLRAGQ